MNDIIKFLKNNFDQHELYEEENEYKSISYESNYLKEISIKQSKGFAVRAIKNKVSICFAGSYLILFCT